MMTAEDVFRRTVDWAMEHGDHNGNVSYQTPYPGTQLHARMVREGRMVTRDWRSLRHAARGLPAGAAEA